MLKTLPTLSNFVGMYWKSFSQDKLKQIKTKLVFTKDIFACNFIVNYVETSKGSLFYKLPVLLLKNWALIYKKLYFVIPSLLRN